MLSQIMSSLITTIVVAALEPHGLAFEAEVREQLTFLSRAYRDHSDMITLCMDGIHHVEDKQGQLIQLLFSS